MISQRIYDGETAEDIGIGDTEYRSRKEIVDRFVAQWSGDNFPADFLSWLRDQPESAGFGRSRGLGDTVAKVTRAVGIKPCGGCKQRQKALNKLFPYGDEKQ